MADGEPDNESEPDLDPDAADKTSKATEKTKKLSKADLLRLNLKAQEAKAAETAKKNKTGAGAGAETGGAKKDEKKVLGVKGQPKAVCAGFFVERRGLTAAS